MNTVKISGVKLSRSGTTSSNEELFTHNIFVFSLLISSFFHPVRKSTEKNDKYSRKVLSGSFINDGQQ
jgi:hypothetical protein